MLFIVIYINIIFSFFYCSCSEDETHAKAHFRRAVAHYNLGHEDAAKDDFARVKKLDPNAAADVDKELARMAARARAASAKQAKEWSFYGGKKK